jgi:hypothetical protein
MMTGHSVVPYTIDMETVPARSQAEQICRQVYCDIVAERWFRLSEQILLFLRWKFCSLVQAARIAGRRLKYT